MVKSMTVLLSKKKCINREIVKKTKDITPNLRSILILNETNI